jgi:NADPH2:quinone reductase
MYTQYRCIPAEQCLRLPDDATPAQGASCFVNPLTALGMVQTMKSEGHSALVHTAAASNLGQMLNRICLQDKVGLVNIVRKRGRWICSRRRARSLSAAPSHPISWPS